jgi:hypothetical protein
MIRYFTAAFPYLMVRAEVSMTALTDAIAKHRIAMVAFFHVEPK